MIHKNKGIGDRYQEETKYTRRTVGTGGFGFEEGADPFKEYPEAEKVVPIPALSPETHGEFWHIVSSRRSHRDYTDASLTFEELCLLLFATQGVTAKACDFLFRTAPSAGGLYPIETYLLVNRVESLPAGLYHFNILIKCLELIRKVNLSQKLAAAALGQSMISEGCLTFIWTAIVQRSKLKYHERAYRYLYMDAGHIGQNLYLGATALGLGCCTIGAFFDDEVNELIGIDGYKETALYMGVIGRIA